MPKNPGIYRGETAPSKVNKVTRAMAQHENPGSSVGRGRPARPGSSFAARFGRVILQNGIAAIPSALFHYQGRLELSAQQVWFVSYVLAHKWDEDLPYPSLKKMAKCTVLSLSQLQRIKNTLCEMDYLRVVPRFSDKQGQQTNAYDFSGLFDRLEQMVIADAPTPNDIRAEGEPPDAAEIAEADPSFVARYGRVITRRGVAAVPRAIFTHQRDLKLTPQQVWFMTYIFSFQWDTMLPYPSLRKMATITGYSRVQLHNIKAELVEAGYLALVHRTNDLGGQDTNAYDFSGLLDAIRALLQPDKPPPTPTSRAVEVAPMRPPIKRRGRRAVQGVGGSGQLAEGGRTELSGRDRIELPAGDSTQLSWGDSIEFTEGGRTEFPEEGRRQLPGRDRAKLSGRDSAELPGGDSGRSAGRGKQTLEGGSARAYPRGIARNLHEVEAIKVETNNKDDSNQVSPNNSIHEDEIPGITLSYSPYIAAVITDFSNELSDPAHIVSNVTQALRLWQQSGKDEQQFTDLLYEAKHRTRRYQGKQGLGTINNKMAYFFTLVRELSRGQ